MAVMADPTTDLIVSTSADGHRFEATVCRPPAPSARLVFLSALGTPGRVYGRLGRELANHGIETVLPDWRGIASSSVRAHRRQDFGYRHLLEHDLPALLAQLDTTKVPTLIGGHSLGGQLALLALATRPEPLRGALLIASGSVHLPGYPVTLQRKIRLLLGISRISGALLGYFPGQRVGFANREARGVMRDWGHVARTGHYRPVGSQIDYETALSALDRPVLALNFAADTWSPASAAARLLAKLPPGCAQLECLDATATHGVALDHFSWTKQPALIAPRVLAFIDSTLSLT
jgi:predicted alpha/beta hydrolase